MSDTRLAIAQLPTAPPGPQDRLTTLPLDVLRVILAHPALDNASFVCLLSTCRAMRGYAITALQPLARARVLHLGWAIATEVEYASFVRQSATSAKNKKSKKKRATDLAHLELAHAAAVHTAAIVHATTGYIQEEGNGQVDTMYSISTL